MPENPSAQPGDASAAAERFRLAMSIFTEAAALDGAARAAVLERRAAGDPALRDEVRAMLRHDDGGGGAVAAIRTGIGLGLRVQPAPVPLHDTTGHAAAARLAGHYRIIRVIGEGGMGVVYEAEQTLPRRTVALKAIRPGLASRTVLERFTREAHILGRLQHPGIAQVYEAGVVENGPSDQAYIVMEYVDGPTLTEHARSKALGTDQRRELVAAVCDAVQHAHQRRVIHRDLKPANILVDPGGRPKVLDFGVAALAADDQHPAPGDADGGAIVGTLAYMAPEQLSPGEQGPDTRADVYSLGVVLFELLSGHLPIPVQEASMLGAMQMIRQREPLSLRAVLPRCSPDCEAIVAKAIRKEPAERYQSASELADDLRRAIRRQPVGARRYSTAQVIGHAVRRHRAAAAASAAAALFLLLFALYAQHEARKEAAASRTITGLYSAADTQRLRLRDALDASSVERGRLLAEAGSMRAAEDLIWPVHLARPSQQSLWALRDLYTRFPCLRTTLAGTSSAAAAACAPDGSLAAVSLADGSAFAVDPVSAEVHVLDTGGVLVERLGFALGSPSLSAVRADHTLLRWNTSTWERSDPVPLPEPNITALSGYRHLYGGGFMVMADDEGGVRVVSPVGTLVIKSIDAAPTSPIRTIAARTDAPVVAIGTDDGRVQVRSLTDWTPLFAPPGHVHAISALAFSPDGLTLASAGIDQLIKIGPAWPGASESKPIERSSRNSPAAALAFSPDGRTLAAAGPLGVDLWDARTGERDAPRLEHRSLSAAFLADGALVSVGGEPDSSGGAGVLGGAEVRLWKPGRCSVRIIPASDLGAGAGGFGTCSPSGEQIVVSGLGIGGILVLDAPTGKQLGVLRSNNADALGYRFSPDGRRLAAGLVDGSYAVWSMETRERLLRFSSEEAASPSGVGGGASASIRFSPDGAALIAGWHDGSLHWYDSTDGHALRSLALDLGEVARLSMSADGALIAVQHRRGGVTIVEAATGRIAHRLSTTRASALTFLPDPFHTLAVGNRDGGVELWDADACSLIRTLNGHTDAVTVLAVGGRTTGGPAAPTVLASVAADGSARLWDPASRSCLESVHIPGASGPAAAVTNISLNRAATVMVTSQGDGSVAVWDLSSADAAIEGNRAWAERRFGSGNGTPPPP